MSNEVQNFEVENVYSGNASDMIGQGAALMQTRSPYSTAVQVIRPRNLNLVEKKCLEEANIAGEEFLYQWPVSEKQSDGTWKKKQLIGLSVGAALAIARNMGNNAIDVTVEEKTDCYMFYGAYIDLETGFNLRRAFRQRKKQNVGDKMKQDGRAEDIVFQIGQSKAIRNVALNAAPSWLTKKVQDAAMHSFSTKVEEQPAKYKKICLDLAKKISIPLDRIETKYGKENGWDVRKIVSLLTDLRTLEDGYDELENVFPLKEAEPTPQPKPQSTGTQAPAPEVEKASAVKEEPKKEEPKKEEPAKEQPKQDYPFDLSDPTTEENPKYHVWAIQNFKGNIQEWNKFKKEHVKTWQQFGGAEYQAIEDAMNKLEAALLSAKK